MASIAPQDFGQPLVLEDFIPVHQAVTFTSPPLCASCHVTVTTFQRCAGCKDSNYCSRTCQTSDWARHKTVCRSFLKLIAPSASTRRALLCTTESKRQFVYLSYGVDGRPIDIAKCFPDSPSEDIQTIAFHNRYLPYWIQLTYVSNLKGRRTLAPSIGGFRGAVVAIAYDPEEGLSAPALNIDTKALGPVLEYATLRKDYNGPIVVEQPQRRWTDEEWKEVAKRSNIEV